jgi:Ca2+-binding RTX toxin-like protein
MPGDPPNYIFGTDGPDRITGTAGDDVIYAGAEYDKVHAGAGNDIVYGGDDWDTIYDGEGSDIVDLGSGDALIFADNKDATGNDLYIGDPSQGGITRVKYHYLSGTVTHKLATAVFVDLTKGKAWGDAIGHDRLQGITDIETGGGDDRIIGSDFVGPRTEQYWDEVFRTNGGDDRINAKSGRDWVNAGPGNDLVLGGDGNDSLHGGSGNDRLYGGDGNDGLTDDDSERRPTTANKDVLCGGDGNDGLMSYWGDDILMGGAGNDELKTQGARTRMYGGDGADVFGFGLENNPEAGHKIIADFEDGIDKMLLNIEAYLDYGTPEQALATARETRSGDAVILQLTPDAHVVVCGLTLATLDLSDFV